MAKDVRAASDLRRQEKVGDPQFTDISKAGPPQFRVVVRSLPYSWVGSQ